MSKAKVLVVLRQQDGQMNGVAYHRLFVPHMALERTHGDQFEFAIVDSLETDSIIDPNINAAMLTEEFVKKFQLVVFARVIGSTCEATEKICSMLERAGCAIMVDQDDYWQLPKDHMHYWTYHGTNRTQNIIDGMKMADCVLTTHRLLADHALLTVDTQVEVIPNAIDTTIEQFQPKPMPQDGIIRIGWIGSSSHLGDLDILKPALQRLFRQRKVTEQIQIVLGGFSVKQKIWHYDPKTQETKQVEMPVDFCAPVQFEKILTDNYKVCGGFPNYVKYLKLYTQKAEEIMDAMPYKRLWYTDVFHYAEMYNHIDIALAPLRDTEFNRCKSNLKILEAGFMGKTVIASDIHPFNSTISHEVDGLLAHHSGDWYNDIHDLIFDEQFRKDLAYNLRSSLAVNYTIDDVNKTRAELYLQLIKQKNS